MNINNEYNNGVLNNFVFFFPHTDQHPVGGLVQVEQDQEIPAQEGALQGHVPHQM